MIKAKEDLTGKRFGRLVVIKQSNDYIDKNGRHHCNWLCHCDCGNNIDVIGTSLTRKKYTKSCGCLHKEIISKILSDNRTKYNIYEFYDNYGVCYTDNKEYYWLFDLEDYDKIKKYYWSPKSDKCNYASAKDTELNTTVQMSRIIMGLSIRDKRKVDHINHNVFDNRKNNLRVCTNSQNNMNKGLQSNNTSGVTGVTWRKDKHKWEAQIRLNRKNIHLGLFPNFDDAVKARKQAEEKYFGEYSYDNSIKKEVRSK